MTPTMRPLASGHRRLGAVIVLLLGLVGALVTVPMGDAAAATATPTCHDGGSEPLGVPGYRPGSECDILIDSYVAQQCDLVHSDTPAGPMDTLTVTCAGPVPPPGVAPVGALEDCVAQGNGDAVCTGWTRDPDSTDPIGVHLYIGGPAGTPDARFVTATADLASEPAVGGGGAHSFSVTIPGVTTSAEIYAYGIGVDASGARDSRNAMLTGSAEVATRVCDGAVLSPEHIAGHLADISEPSARQAFVADPCRVVQDTDLSGPITEGAGVDPVFPGFLSIENLGNDCARVTARYEITHTIAGAAPVEATVDACARFDTRDETGQGPRGWVVTGPGGTGEPQVSLEVGAFPIARGGGAWTIQRGGLGNTGILATRYVPYGEGNLLYDQGAWQAQMGFNVRFFLNAFFVGGGTVDRSFEETAWLPELTYSMLQN